MAIVDPSAALQVAIVARLQACGSAADKRVYDRVPANRVFPYIALGNVQVISELIEGFSGAEVYITIDAWSQAPGKLEMQGLGKSIIAALDDADLSGDGIVIKSCLLSDVQYVPDPDGLTSHGIFTFHILTD